MKKYLHQTAWRSPTGYQHDRGQTAEDVVAYEEKELKNDIHVEKLTRAFLKHIAAKDVFWITKTKTAAKRYGDPEPVPCSALYIIGEDDEDGCLVVPAKAINKIKSSESMLVCYHIAWTLPYILSIKGPIAAFLTLERVNEWAEKRGESSNLWQHVEIVEIARYELPLIGEEESFEILKYLQILQGCFQFRDESEKQFLVGVICDQLHRFEEAIWREAGMLEQGEKVEVVL